MRLEDIRPIEGSKRRKRRVGRGIAAGQGASCGFGMRGQKARSGKPTRPGFEGGQLPLYRRIPKLKHFPIVNQKVYTIVNVSWLAKLPADTVVTMGYLMDAGIIKSDDGPLKILGDGELDVALIVKATAFTKSAKAKIESAGGHAEISEYIPLVRKYKSLVNLDRKRVMANFKQELEALRDYRKNWDSYESQPPNEDAISNSTRVLEISEKVDIEPTTVIPSAEGGVGISFWNKDKYADIECFNTGEMIAVTYDRSNPAVTPKTWYIDSEKDKEITDTLQSIKEFVHLTEFANVSASKK